MVSEHDLEGMCEAESDSVLGCSYYAFLVEAVKTLPFIFSFPDIKRWGIHFPGVDLSRGTTELELAFTTEAHWVSGCLVMMVNSCLGEQHLQCHSKSFMQTSA